MYLLYFNDIFKVFSTILTIKRQVLNILLNQYVSSSFAVEKLPVVDYGIKECSVSDIERNLLNKDQQYLLDISKTIILWFGPRDLITLNSDSLRFDSPFEMIKVGSTVICTLEIIFAIFLWFNCQYLSS